MYKINLAPSLVILLGLTVVFGWFIGSTELIQVLPTFVPMQFNTATCFILIGTSLGLAIHRKQKTSIIVSLLTVAFTSLTIAQYIYNIDFGIDELFFTHHITTKTSHPGRMAPNTAICFILASISILSYIILQRLNQDKIFLASMLSLCGLSSALIAFTGYLADVPTSYGWGAYTQMAVHTSFGFIIWFAGFLYFSRCNSVKTIHSINTLLTTVVFFVSLTIFLYLSQASAEKEHESLQVTQKNSSRAIANSIEEIFRLTNEALIRMASRWETGGYTNNESWERDTDHYLEHFKSLYGIQLLNNDFVSIYTKSKNNIHPIPKIGPRSKFINLSKKHNILISKITKNDRSSGFWLLYPNEKSKSTTYFAAYLSMEALAKLAITDEANRAYSIELLYNNHRIFENSVQKNQSLVNTEINITHNFKLYDIPFQIVSQPTKSTLSDFNTFVPEAILFLGVLITMLIYLLTSTVFRQRRINNIVNLLLESTRAISKSNNFDIALTNCIMGILNIIRWDIGRVFKVSKNEYGEFHTSHKALDISLGKYIKVFDEKYNENILQKVLKTLKPVYFNDVNKNNFFSFLHKSSSIKASIAIPVLKNDQVVLVLQFYKTGFLNNTHEAFKILRVLSEHISSEYCAKEANLIIEKKTIELTEKNRQLEVLSNIDPLTGSYNRRAFELEAGKIFSYAKRHKTLNAIVFIDLDDFKIINDTYGHDNGDKLIKITASRIDGVLRHEDVLARLGGDEFVVCLSNIKREQAIDVIINKIRESVEFPIIIERKEVIVKTSIGYKVCGYNESLQECLKAADEKLYENKKKRKEHSK